MRKFKIGCLSLLWDWHVIQWRPPPHIQYEHTQSLLCDLNNSTRSSISCKTGTTGSRSIHWNTFKAVIHQHEVPSSLIKIVNSFINRQIVSIKNIITRICIARVMSAHDFAEVVECEENSADDI